MQYALNVLRRVRNRILRFPFYHRAKFMEIRINVTGRPAIFKDKLGYKYWLYPGDPIIEYHQRGYTTDSSSVMRYVKCFVKPGAVCVDIGARIGAISLALWDSVGQNGLVISVEADPENINSLKLNLELNGCPSGKIENAAITNYYGVARLRRFEGCNGWQTVGDPEFAKNVPSVFFDVPSMTFSQLISAHQLKNIGFVKIDVEGAEPMVLDGMRELLAEQRIEQVLFEVNHLMLQGTGHTVDDLMHFWSEFKYQLYLVGPNGERRDLPERKWPDGYIGDCVAILEA